MASPPTSSIQSSLHAQTASDRAGHQPTERVGNLETKACTKCGQEKTLDNFYRISKGDERRAKRCKTCCDVYQKEWSKAHRKELAEYRVAYNQRPYRRFSEFVSRAKQRGLSVSISDQEFRSLHSGHCHYCGDPAASVGIDRLDSTFGYQPGNVVTCCRRCNTAKMAMPFREFIELCHRIANRHPLPISGVAS